MKLFNKKSQKSVLRYADLEEPGPVLARKIDFSAAILRRPAADSD